MKTTQSKIIKNLLTVDNTKLLKSNDFGYLSIGLHLAPYNLADKNINLCPFSTKSCRETCLNFSGHSSMSKVQQSRIDKTLYYINNRELFLIKIYE